MMAGAFVASQRLLWVFDGLGGGGGGGGEHLGTNIKMCLEFGKLSFMKLTCEAVVGEVVLLPAGERSGEMD